MASLILLAPVHFSSRTFNSRSKKMNCTRGISNDYSHNEKQVEEKNGGGLQSIVQVVHRDAACLTKGFSSGLQWAKKAFQIPEVSKSVEDLIWMRNVEEPESSNLQMPSWPRVFYPELVGVDLFLADIKALEVYASYFYQLSMMWTKPLPEVYGAELVTEYFTLRPHVVAIRLIEVVTAFVYATIKFKISTSSAANKDARENTSNYTFGMILKETMLDLGPTFIKIGQSLSTRPDIIGFEMSKALSELHDRIPPFPNAKAMKIIEEELGSPADTCFSYLSEEPVAAASFGQVYKAKTLDGFDVAVKVQRPNMRNVVLRDIYILRLGLGLFQKIAKRQNDIRPYADELGKGLIGELDYNLEAANALEFMEVHSHFSFMCSPKVFPHLSNKRVLTMEWMVGDSPNDLVAASSLESRRKLLDLVSKGVEASLVQLLETGLMHADPHPGNMLYTSSGKLGFLDFGLLCRMEKKHQFAMLAAIVHIVNGDWACLVQDLREMDVIKPGTNLRRFTMDLEDAVGELEFNDGIPDIKFSRVLGKIWSVALKYHCRLPPYYILVLRSLASLEGLAVAGDPNFKTFEAAYPYVVQKLLVDNSAATRRILHSAVFNRRREFQWQKLAMFLRVGATRKGLQSIISSNSEKSLTQSVTGVAPEVNLANLALTLLQSEKGLVLRRLLMTADGASLVQALVSVEAAGFRHQFCKFIADILYQRMSESLGKALNLNLSKFGSTVPVSTMDHHQQTLPTKSEYESILRDRRLRVIFFKYVTSARKDPMLFLRLCSTSFVMVLVASAMACYRVVLSLSRAYLSRLSYSSKQVAMTAA